MNIFQQLADEMSVTKHGEIIGLSRENAQKILDSFNAQKEVTKNVRAHYKKIILEMKC